MAQYIQKINFLSVSFINDYNSLMVELHTTIIDLFIESNKQYRNSQNIFPQLTV